MTRAGPRGVCFRHRAWPWSFDGQPAFGHRLDFHRHGRARRDRRQDPVAGPAAGRAFPQTLADHRWHPGGDAAQHALATTVAFFIVEIGDKTQIATVLLAARYHPLWEVIVGTTAGMLLANVPVVVLGSRFADRLPLRAARYVAAAIFLGLAIWVAVRGVGG